MKSGRVSGRPECLVFTHWLILNINLSEQQLERSKTALGENQVPEQRRPASTSMKKTVTQLLICLCRTHGCSVSKVTTLMNETHINMDHFYISFPSVSLSHWKTMSATSAWSPGPFSFQVIVQFPPSKHKLDENITLDFIKLVLHTWRNSLQITNGSGGPLNHRFPIVRHQRVIESFEKLLWF